MDVALDRAIERLLGKVSCHHEALCPSSIAAYSRIQVQRVCAGSITFLFQKGRRHLLVLPTVATDIFLVSRHTLVSLAWSSLEPLCKVGSTAAHFSACCKPSARSPDLRRKSSPSQVLNGKKSSEYFYLTKCLVGVPCFLITLTQTLMIVLCCFLPSLPRF